MNKLLAAILAAAVSMGANASVMQQVDITYASGAEFSGIVTFADDFSAVTAVNGNLTEAGKVADPITWLWGGGYNFAAGSPGLYGTFLMNNTINRTYTNFISFTYDYSDISNLQFSNRHYGNFTGRGSPLVSGSFSAIVDPSATPVPEPMTPALIGLGLMALVALRRKAQQ